MDHCSLGLNTCAMFTCGWDVHGLPTRVHIGCAVPHRLRHFSRVLLAWDPSFTDSKRGCLPICPDSPSFSIGRKMGVETEVHSGLTCRVGRSGERNLNETGYLKDGGEAKGGSQLPWFRSDVWGRRLPSFRQNSSDACNAHEASPAQQTAKQDPSVHNHAETDRTERRFGRTPNEAMKAVSLQPQIRAVSLRPANASTRGKNCPALRAVATDFSVPKKLDTKGNTSVQLCELKHRYCVKYNIDEEVVVKNPAHPHGPEFIAKHAVAKGERFISRDALVDGKQRVACANALGVDVCLMMEMHDKRFDIHMEISGVDIGQPLMDIAHEDIPFVNA